MKTFQAKLTEEELENALKALVVNIINYGLSESNFERFNYLGKRLLKIQKGEPEIETEVQSEEQAANNQAAAQTWS